ncbi:MAG: hypothetical protein ACJ759_05480 [Thermoanaerobaculia bacterium]
MGWSRSRLERLLQLRSRRAEGEPDADETAQGYDYSEAFAGAERALAAYFAAESPGEASPAELWDELSPLPAEEQIRRASEERRFSSPGLVRHLLEASHAARFEDPEASLHRAHLACLVAGSCTAELCGSPERLADLSCQAWRQYGETLRAKSRLRESEAALARAQRLSESGTGDPALRAQLLSSLVSLRIYQRRFAEAISLSEGAEQVYQSLGQKHALASTLVRKATAYIYSGEPGDAVSILNRVIPMIEEEDPHLLLVACHNLVRCYIDLERPEQALSLFFETRSLYREFNDAMILLRAGWQEGLMLRELGHLHAAEAALVRARDGFCEHKIIYEAAIVSLDLAAIYVKLGDAEKLEQIVATTVPIFRSLGVDREVLASLLQLRQLMEQGQQAFELIRLLGSKVEQLGRSTS